MNDTKDTANNKTSAQEEPIRAEAQNGSAEDIKAKKAQKKSLQYIVSSRKLKKYKKRARKRLITIFVLIAFLCLSFFYSPLIGKYVGALRQGEPIKEVTEDILGRKTIKIQNAILGETRERQELVVMEQDIEIESAVSTTLANLSVFSKTKTIHSFATGVYTVDMSNINKENIEVDEKTKTVTVLIPHCVLQYVNLNIEKTRFEETQKGWLAFGDIKLTQEQQQVLNEEIYNTMRETLDTKQLKESADELALLKVWEIFCPLVEAVSDEYNLNVIFTPGSQNAQ